MSDRRELRALLAEVRGHYVERLFETLEQLERDGARVAVQPLLCDEAGAPIREGELSLPLRVDATIFRGDEGETVAVETDSMLSYTPIELPWARPEGEPQRASGDQHQMTVHIEPFQWEGLELRVMFSGLTVDLQPLSRWFEKWVDLEDERNDGVVHFLSDAAVEGDGTTSFEIDLGTAPIESLEDLFDVLVSLGATKVVVTALPIEDDGEGEDAPPREPSQES